MCNLYSITKGQQAIRDLAGAMRDLTGNLPMLPGVFPDYSAPIVRTAVDGVRELTMARWGMPSPIFALKGRKSDGGVTNIRNVASPPLAPRSGFIRRRRRLRRLQLGTGLRGDEVASALHLQTRQQFHIAEFHPRRRGAIAPIGHSKSIPLPFDLIPGRGLVANATLQRFRPIHGKRIDLGARAYFIDISCRN